MGSHIGCLYCLYCGDDLWRSDPINYLFDNFSFYVGNNVGVEEDEPKRFVDMQQARKMFTNIQDLIQEVNFIHSEKMLEIANQMVELKMFLFPDSFKTVNVSMGDLMGMMEKSYGNLQNVPAQPLRMTRDGPKCIQADGEESNSSNEEGRAD